MARMKLPPLNPLRSFEATARHLSVTRAATELFVTHSAVSHQIRALEESLGVKLFVRDGTNLRLTVEGQRLLPAVSKAFEAIADATGRMLRPEMEGRLAISCVPALMVHWLMPRISSFVERFPGVRLVLSSSNSRSEVMSSDFDLCIRYGDGTWEGRWVRELTTLDLVPVCSPQLFKRHEIKTIDDLQHHPILHGDSGKEWSRWLAASGETDLLSRTPQHFMSDAHLAILGAREGMGVALGDSVTLHDVLATGELVVPIQKSVPASDSHFIICRHEILQTPLVEAFVDWITSDIRHRPVPVTRARRVDPSASAM